MLGKGTYDEAHDIAHRATGAVSSILIVVSGKDGHGMSCKIMQEHLKSLPDMLRLVADNIGPEIKQDLEKIAEITGEPQHEEPTTEDTGPHSFAG